MVLLAACSGATPPEAAEEDPAVAENAAENAESGNTPQEDVFLEAVGDIPPAGALPDYPLQVPPGFRISIYADGLGEVRQLVFDAEGVPYVTIMNRGEPDTGKLLALPDRNGDGQADEIVSTLEPLDRPHGLQFYEGALYVSEPDRIHRIIDADGDLVAEETEIVVDEMPAEGDHWARPFVFDPEGNLLVAIGSSCNATCFESSVKRATIWRFGADGSDIGPVASGLRSVVDMAYNPVNGELWAVNNGRDFAPEMEPIPDTAHIINGRNHGWPFCLGDGRIDSEVAARDDRNPPDGLTSEEFCAEVAAPGDMVLPPHVAPLGVTFYNAEQFPPEYQGGMFQGWHGAFDFQNTNGYRVVYVPLDEAHQPQEPESFISWVMPDESGWFGRPLDVTVGPEGSLYITDDFGGKVFRVDYIGEAASN